MEVDVQLGIYDLEESYIQPLGDSAATATDSKESYWVDVHNNIAIQGKMHLFGVAVIVGTLLKPSLSYMY